MNPCFETATRQSRAVRMRWHDIELPRVARAVEKLLPCPVPPPHARVG
jgi:hypothetical protein